MAKRKPKFEVIDGTSEEHKAFAGKNFSLHNLATFAPQTPRQEQFVKSFYNDTPMIMQLGSAGTGKSFTSLYCALSDVISKETVYDKVVIVRSAVATRDIGFLPGGADTIGSEESKLSVYEAPYKAICDEILNFKSKNYDNLKAKGIIEFHSTSFLRGQTFNNAIILVEECQSMNFHELSTVTSRCGVNSRLIFTGDYRQTDLIKKSSDKSGLGDFLKIVEHMPKECVDVITYKPEDIVRSGFVKEFLIASEKAGF